LETSEAILRYHGDQSNYLETADLTKGAQIQYPVYGDIESFCIW
jgi:hypothetical protein